MNRAPETYHSGRRRDLSAVRRGCPHPTTSSLKAHLKLYRREYHQGMAQLGAIRLGLLVSVLMMRCYVSQCPNQGLVVLDSLKEFAEKIRWQPATVRKHLEALQELGYLRVLKRPNRGNQGPWVIQVDPRMRAIEIRGARNEKIPPLTPPRVDLDSVVHGSRHEHKSPLRTSTVVGINGTSGLEERTPEKNGSGDTPIEFESEQGFLECLDRDYGFENLPEGMRRQAIDRALRDRRWGNAVLRPCPDDVEDQG